MSDDVTVVHQVDLNAGHIGKRVSGTTGRLDFEGVLQAVYHEADEEISTLGTLGAVRIRTRTTITVSGYELLLARGSQVRVS